LVSVVTNQSELTAALPPSWCRRVTVRPAGSAAGVHIDGAKGTKIATTNPQSMTVSGGAEASNVFGSVATVLGREGGIRAKSRRARASRAMPYKPAETTTTEPKVRKLA